jgi:hypothetical protein
LLEFKPRPVAQSLVIKIMEMKLWFMWDLWYSRWRAMSSGMWYSSVFVNVYRLFIWTWTHSLKRRCSYTRLHGTMHHNKAMFVFLTVSCQTKTFDGWNKNFLPWTRCGVKNKKFPFMTLDDCDFVAAWLHDGHVPRGLAAVGDCGNIRSQRRCERQYVIDVLKTNLTADCQHPLRMSVTQFIIML